MLTLISVALFLLSSAFLVWYFLKHDHGAREPAGALLAVFGFGILAFGGAIWAELFLPNPSSASITLTGLFFCQPGGGNNRRNHEVCAAGPLYSQKRLF